MFKISIENMEQEIHYIKNNCGLSGLSYDGVSTSPTYKISSATENTALSNSEKIDFLEHNIKRNKMQLERIDRSLNGLTYKERTMLELKYIKGMRWESVMSETNYSERHCRRIKNEAINKMIIGLFNTK